MLGSSVVYKSESLRVDYFRNDKNEYKKLVFVFSACGNRTLYGNSFGGDFLLMNGFDVIAFKSIADNWFQDVPHEVFVTIDDIVKKNNYSMRAAMATSMGAYAAIAFSKYLKCDLILAYAPQYTVSSSFDARFDVGNSIEWRYTISEGAINRECKYIFVYDNRDFDRFHVLRLRDRAV